MKMNSVEYWKGMYDASRACFVILSIIMVIATPWFLWPFEFVFLVLVFFGWKAKDELEKMGKDQ